MLFFLLFFCCVCHAKWQDFKRVSNGKGSEFVLGNKDCLECSQCCSLTSCICLRGWTDYLAAAAAHSTRVSSSSARSSHERNFLGSHAKYKTLPGSLCELQPNSILTKTFLKATAKQNDYISKFSWFGLHRFSVLTYHLNLKSHNFEIFVVSRCHPV